MSTLKDPIATESTALLGSSPSAPTLDHHSSSWYWPWPPSYWAILPTIFMGGLFTSPASTMAPPLLKIMFCERGIPALVATLHAPNDAIMGGQCDSSEYSAAIARFYAVYVSVTAVFVTFTVRYWSSLSDRIGRKPVLMIWSIGIFMAHSITLLVYYVRGLSLYILWVGAMVDGLTGSVSSALALTHAYAADVTIPSSRTIIFGRIMAGYFGGFGLGAAWAGIIVVKYGVLGVFWVLPGLSLLNLLYLVLIPESISKNDNPKPKSPSTSCSSMDTIVANENPAVKHNANIAHHIRATFHSFVPEQLPNRLGGKYSVTKVMIVSLLALMGALGVNYQTSTYLMYRFNWSGSQLGLFGSIRGLSRFVTLTVFLPLAKRYAPGGPSTDPASNIRFDLNMLVVAILLEVLTLLMFGLATVGELFYVGAMTGAFGTMFYPTIRSILSRAVSPEMLGTALGALGTFEAISEIIAPPLTAWFYGITLETHPSAIFYLGAAIAFLGWALALSVLITHNHASVNL